ncbi:MAG: amine dehydrogenase, partial [Proteobacteria bacterium]|nr:amine dehydrogenase [Pseudomonadota bacterium]
MPNRSKFQLMSGALLLCGLAAGSAQAAGPAPIAAEPMPAVRGLPATLPQDWIMVHDVNGGSITDGRVVFVDIGARPEVRAQVGASYLANFQLVPARHELYIAETFYSRVNRGERSDVISIYDTTTLQNIGEIALPGGKRAVVIPDPGGFQLINDGKWGLVFNFTPGASV